MICWYVLAVIHVCIYLARNVPYSCEIQSVSIYCILSILNLYNLYLSKKWTQVNFYIFKKSLTMDIVYQETCSMFCWYICYEKDKVGGLQLINYKVQKENISLPYSVYFGFSLSFKLSSCVIYARYTKIISHICIDNSLICTGYPSIEGFDMYTRFTWFWFWAAQNFCDKA